MTKTVADERHLTSIIKLNEQVPGVEFDRIGCQAATHNRQDPLENHRRKAVVDTRSDDDFLYRKGIDGFERWRCRLWASAV